MSERKPSRAKTETWPLAIDCIEIIPLDIVPVNTRRMPTGPHLDGGPGSWVGRPLVLRIRAQGLSGSGEIRPVNPFVGQTAAIV